MVRIAKEPTLFQARTERQTADHAVAARPLRWLMAAVIVLPLALFCVGAVNSYFGALDDARGQMSRLSDVVHEHAEKVFEAQALVVDGAEEIVSGLSDAAIEANESAIDARLARLKQRLEQIEDIRIIGANGRLLAAARPETLANRDYRDRDFFSSPRDLRLSPSDVYVSAVQPSRAIPGRSFFHVARRRLSGDTDADGFPGVVAVVIDPGYFEAFYRDVTSTVPSAIALFKDTGDRLARFPPSKASEPRVLTIDSFLRAARRNPDRGIYDADDSLDGRDRIIAYRRLSAVPVYVGAGIERATIVAAWARGLGNLLLLGVPALALVLALVVMAQRRLASEQRALARLRAETALREDTEAQLRQSQKLDAIGRLTGGIAHDFNNLLTIIAGSLDLIERRAENDPRLQRLVGNAREGATRAGTLTRQLLAFARRQPLDPRATDINRLVSDLSSLLRRTLGEAVVVETVLGGGAWAAIVDPPQLENALVNLAVNARDAMPEGGRLTIETANVHVDDAYARANQGVAPGQYVTISVTDTGTGIAPDILDKVVEPFFTTKPVGQGTGLGLSQVFGFIRQSGGNVKIYSEVGVGTTVRLYLPRHFGAVAPREDVTPATQPAALARNWTVLVAEDDTDVRSLTAEALSECGYRVVVAENGADALDQLSREPDINVLLTDVVMPVMDGRKLADAAHKLRPNLPVVFMTGYTPNAIVHNGTLDPGVHLLTKPFTLRQLADKVQAALAEADTSPAKEDR